MGEFSKKVGERGEKLVGDFLNLIGWGAAQHGLALPCVKPDKHTITGARRQTHGVDYFLSHRSAFIDEVFQNLVISVKFTSEAYPNSPAATFKQHFLDLTSALECFHNSELRRDAMRSRNGIRETQDIGVLFWWSNSRDTYEDVVSKLQALILPDDNRFQAVHIVDNKQAAFIYDALTFARHLPDTRYSFHYHESGRNLNPLVNSKNGSILPVEFITSPIIPLRVETASEVRLMLFLNEPFEASGLRRMIGLAQKLSGDWTRHIDICFPEFDPLFHENTVQSVKNTFEDKQITDAVHVISFRSDFRNTRR